MRMWIYMQAKKCSRREVLEQGGGGKRVEKQVSLTLLTI
jgi:hypothetical protein